MPASRDAAVLYVTHPIFSQHQTGPYHPERTARLRAVDHGVQDCRPPDPQAEPAESGTRRAGVGSRTGISRRGREVLSEPAADTSIPTRWWCRRVGRLRCGPPGRVPPRWRRFPRRTISRIAFLALRPPGHHATPNRAMGFCLINNIGVTAGLLASQGAKVAIVDWDVHHGNGTQAMFYRDPNVLYVSIHQFPFYPYEGRAEEVGEGRESDHREHPGAGRDRRRRLPDGLE